MTDEFAGIQLVFLDACCVINLYASHYMADIVRSLPTDIFIAKRVLEDEALYVQRLGDDGVLDKEPIDLSSLVDSGLLAVADIQTAEEQMSVVNFAALRFDDGEAITVALALHRGAAVATDERRIIRILREQFPQVPVLTTSALVRYWAEQQHLLPLGLRTVLKNIELGGQFIPGNSDAHQAWWQAASNYSEL